MSYPRVLNNRFRRNRSNVFHVGPRNDYTSIEAALDVGVNNTPEGGIVELVVDPKENDEAWEPTYTLPNTHNFIFRSNGLPDHASGTNSGTAFIITNGLTFDPYSKVNEFDARIYRNITFDGIQLGKNQDWPQNPTTILSIPAGWKANIFGCLLNKVRATITDEGVDQLGPGSGTTGQIIINSCMINSTLNLTSRKVTTEDIVDDVFGDFSIANTDLSGTCFLFERVDTYDFSAGGGGVGNEVVPGDTIYNGTGVFSEVLEVTVTSGSWAGNDAAGTIKFATSGGPAFAFANGEVLDKQDPTGFPFPVAIANILQIDSNPESLGTIKRQKFELLNTSLFGAGVPLPGYRDKIFDLYFEAGVRSQISFDTVSLGISTLNFGTPGNLDIFSPVEYSTEFRQMNIAQDDSGGGTWSIGLTNASQIIKAPIITSCTLIPTDTYYPPRTVAWLAGNGSPAGSVPGTWPMQYIDRDTGDIYQSTNVDVTNTNWRQIG